MRRAVALLILVLLSASTIRAIEIPPAREKWITLHADEFSIFSNASERDTIEIATNLLRMRDAIGTVTLLKVRSALPTKVYIFRDTRSFAPYRDAVFHHKASNISGAFFGGEIGNYILLTGATPNGIDRVVYHELTHYFVKNTLAGLPLWFNEGIAEYYSTFSTKGDDVNLGMVIPEHVAWLRTGLMMSLPELFAIDSNSKDYNEGSRQGVFYAQSWALVHYLLGTPEHRQQLAKYLALVRANRPIDDAFRTAFDTTFDAMDRELRAYVRRFTFTYTRYSLASLHPSAVPPARPMTHDEVAYELGDVLLRTGRENFAEAEKFLVAAVSENPNLADAHGDLGLLHMISGQTAAATEEYEKAIQLRPTDANVYLIYGTSIVEKIASSARGPGGANAADVAKARTLLQKAADLDPSSARAWASLGWTYLVTHDDLSPGITALEKSMALSPAQKEVPLYLVQIYARAGRRSDANRIIETVIARAGDAEMLRQAREAVIIADVESADAMLRDGKTAEAALVLRSALTATTRDELKTYISETLKEIDEHEATAHQLDAMQAAAKLAQNGKIKEALAAVDAVIPSITDPELLAKAKEFREQLAKEVARRKK